MHILMSKYGFTTKQATHLAWEQTIIANNGYGRLQRLANQLPKALLGCFERGLAVTRTSTSGSEVRTLTLTTIVFPHTEKGDT